jgi:hypothetical protein
MTFWRTPTRPWLTWTLMVCCRLPHCTPVPVCRDAVDDISNYTNRSPYPTLHLLREESIDRAVAAFPNPEAIFETNMQTMETLGQAGWDALKVGASQ